MLMMNVISFLQHIKSTLTQSLVVSIKNKNVGMTLVVSLVDNPLCKNIPEEERNQILGEREALLDRVK